MRNLRNMLRLWRKERVEAAMGRAWQRWLLDRHYAGHPVEQRKWDAYQALKRKMLRLSKVRR